MEEKIKRGTKGQPGQKSKVRRRAREIRGDIEGETGWSARRMELGWVLLTVVKPKHQGMSYTPLILKSSVYIGEV